MTGMKTITPILSKPKVVYPESDDEPIAENTKQYEYIVTVKGGLDAVFRDNPNVFVAADLFWYPVKGNNKIRTAPDTMVAFGRPKGHRGSYLQWREGDVAPQAVFEILSPGNRVGKLAEKFEFYDQYGVEEYYVYDPDEGMLAGWLRKKKKLTVIKNMEGWISPRLKVRFELHDGELYLFAPDGKKFSTFAELVEQAKKGEERAAKLAAQLKTLGVEPEA
jgi:Uma2 family endonuclease